MSREMLKVLLVEGDHGEAFRLRKLLAPNGAERTGFEVEWLSELEEVWKRLGEGGIDAVLVDADLKTHSGSRAIAQACARFPQIPVVALASVSCDAVSDVCGGAEDWISRDQATGTLVARTLRHAVERHRLRTELDETAEKLRRATEKLEELVTIDPLTGLLNRRGLGLVLAQEIAALKRDGSELYALVLDLDDFRKVNDAYGHAVGDVVLKEIGHRIKSSLRKTDHAARLGADEFMVLLPQSKCVEAVHAAERLRVGITASPVVIAKEETRLTASVGLAAVPDNTLALDEVVTAAEALMSQSKRRGKNQVSFRKVLEGLGAESEALFSNFMDALRDNERFRTVKQGIFDLEDSRVVGYEFLSRFSFDGFEMPDTFFTVCAERNVLNQIDLQCLRNCLRDARMVSVHMRKHVNLFPSTLLGLSPEMLLEHFAEIEAPHNYCIEVSEQQIIGDASNLQDAIHAIKKEGMMVAIDDVGFGKSHLESLIVLQPDIIKIDRKCIHGISRDPARLQLLKRLLRTVKTVSFQIVAEGIEDQEDLAVLLDLGVRYGQGFLLGAPA
jgi:diguanylate cyclase (GGDEF)-like protein